jgi:hypothetical protein
MAALAAPMMDFSKTPVRFHNNTGRKFDMFYSECSQKYIETYPHGAKYYFCLQHEEKVCRLITSAQQENCPKFYVCEVEGKRFMLIAHVVVNTEQAKQELHFTLNMLRNVCVEEEQHGTFDCFHISDDCSLIRYDEDSHGSFVNVEKSGICLKCFNLLHRINHHHEKINQDKRAADQRWFYRTLTWLCDTICALIERLSTCFCCGQRKFS